MGVQERKERDFKRREQAILGAALSLFGADDWQSVTIDQIARRAEIGKGTVYLHFAGKDEIYARLALDFYADMLSRLQAIPAELAVLEQLRQWIRVAWRCHRRGREYHRLVTYCHRDDFRSGLAPQTRAAFDRLEQSFYQPLQHLLRRGRDEGLVADWPLPRLANILRAAFDGAAMLLWHPCLEGEDPERFIDDYTDFMLAGLSHCGTGRGSMPAEPAAADRTRTRSRETRRS